MYFLHNCLYFFRNIYYILTGKNNNTIETFLRTLSKNWSSLTPNDPLYYDILNLYIKYHKENTEPKNCRVSGSEKRDPKIKEYISILNKLNLQKDINKEELEPDINDNMKCYIVGWYILNMCKIKED